MVGKLSHVKEHLFLSLSLLAENLQVYWTLFLRGQSLCHQNSSCFDHLEGENEHWVLYVLWECICILFFFCYRQYCGSQFLSEKICHHLVPHFKRMRWYLPHWEWFCLPLVMQAPLAPIQIWMLRCVSVNNSHVPISLAPRIPPPSLLLQTTKKRCWFAGILPGSQQFFPAQSQSSRGF